VSGPQAPPPAVAGGGRAGRRPGQRPGRRGGDSGTKEAILAAARKRFGEVGYDRATIRSIAASAGVDPALVHHFFGTKERLFARAMRLPFDPADLLAGPARAGAGLGEQVLRTVLGVWDVAEMRAAFLGLLRTAVASDEGAALLREFATGAILGRVAQVARNAPAGGEGPHGGEPPGDSDYRAALVGSQVLGLALTRYVIQLGPLVEASNADLAAALGPTLDRYLTGDVRAQRPGGG
jgi:AcrR family transcriptional regulator